MKILLIKASADSQFKEYKASMGGPPQNIFAAAAATPSEYDLEMIDETIGKKINFNTKADLIVIFFSTPDALRGYKIAERFMSLNKTVVLGGLHVSALPEEADHLCHSVLIGEIENYWSEMLSDAKSGQLKPRYQSTVPVDLSRLKPYPTHLLSPKDYRGVWSVVVGRGCDNACTYCVVNPFFKKLRFRPVKDIVDEIKASGAKIIELHADNLIADRAYAIQLFKALIPLKIRWIGECTITVAEDDELLDLMVRSGLSDLLVGLETPDQEALDNIGKSFIRVENLKGYVSKIQSLGVDIDASFLFGFDEHGRDIFDKTLKFAAEVGIASCHSVILTPFPGTPFYNKIVNEGRLLTREYIKYDCTHAVFKPKHMTALELEQGAYWFDVQFDRVKKGKKISKPSPTAQNSQVDENMVKVESGVSDTLKPDLSNVQAGYKKEIKWKAIIGLVLVVTSVVMNWPVLLGFLYLTWAIQDIQTGYAFILEDVSRADHPILYWLTVGIWLLSGLYVVAEPLIVRFWYM